MADPTSGMEAAINDADLMRIWGTINALWDNIEFLLYQAFDGMLLDADDHETYAIFFSQKSHAARRSMLEELAKRHFVGADKESIQKFKNAIKRVKARSDQRNELTHGFWTIRPGPGDTMDAVRYLIRPQMADEIGAEYDKERLMRVVDDMRSTSEALAEVVRPFALARKEKRNRNMREFFTLLSDMRVPSPGKYPPGSTHS